MEPVTLTIAGVLILALLAPKKKQTLAPSPPQKDIQAPTHLLDTKQIQDFSYDPVTGLPKISFIEDLKRQVAIATAGASASSAVASVAGTGAGVVVGAAVLGSIAGYNVGDQLDKAFGGQQTSIIPGGPDTKDTAIYARVGGAAVGSASFAGIAAAIFGFSFAVPLLVAAFVLLIIAIPIYVTVAWKEFAKRVAQYGQEGARRDWLKVWELRWNDLQTQFQANKGLCSDTGYEWKAKYIQANFAEGYCFDMNHSAYTHFLKNPTPGVRIASLGLSKFIEGNNFNAGFFVAEGLDPDETKFLYKPWNKKDNESREILVNEAITSEPTTVTSTAATVAMPGMISLPKLKVVGSIDPQKIRNDVEFNYIDNQKPIKKLGKMSYNEARYILWMKEFSEGRHGLFVDALGHAKWGHEVEAYYRSMNYIGDGDAFYTETQLHPPDKDDSYNRKRIALKYIDNPHQVMWKKEMAKLKEVQT